MKMSTQACTDLSPIVPGALRQLSYVSRKHKYVFLAVPKVACSTIILSLQRLEQNAADYAPNRDADIHVRSQCPLSTVNEDLSPLRDPAFFKWAFVREPFDRLMSCWLEKVHNGPLRPRFEEKLGRQGPVSLEAFIDVACDEPFAEMESHYAPQYNITLQDHVQLDFIGRFENFAMDIEAAFRTIGQPWKTFESRVDAHKTGEKPWHMMTPTLERKIVDKWYRDFERFGYAMQKPQG
jgi:hypothetical protein